jgi:hypothetical protein
MKRLVAVPVKDDKIWLAVTLEDSDIADLKRYGVDVREVDEGPMDKKGFAFVAPLVASLPAASVVIGAATLGIVGGAASVVGNRIGDWVWPKKGVKDG